MINPTYSFADVSLVLSHPAIGTFTFTGEGVGSVTIARANDVTAHDLAADGSVMPSKIIAKNGTMALAIQQTSAGHAWLKKAYAYLENAPTDQWVGMTGVLKDPALGDTINMTGISFQKKADAGYQQTGQQVGWNFMVCEITG